MSHYKDQEIADSIMRPVEIIDAPAPSHDWLISPKLNGVFARWEPGRGLFSKRGILFRRRLIPHIYKALEDTSPNLALDGEIWAPSFMLGEITGALSHERDDTTPLAHMLKYHIFDAPLTFVPYYRRHSRINALASNNILVVPYKEHTGEEHFPLNDTFDGHIYRRRLGIYSAGPCNNVQKLKSWRDMELPVISVTLGYKHEKSFMQALVCSVGATSVSVGTGFSMNERALFNTHPPKSIKVRYINLSADGVPLNPSYIGLDL